MTTIIMIMVIINRIHDLQRIKNLGPWIYISGRRKTGKTFFVKNFLDYDRYFFVRRDGSVIDEHGRILSFETFFELFKELLGKEKVVIDEFHRLPKDFMDYLHYTGIKGELLIISSSLHLSKELLGSGSPLMGLFSLFLFGLCNEKDLLISLKENLNGKELIEASIYLKEPVLAPRYKPKIRSFLTDFLYENRLILSEIIGEIFLEETRTLSNVYDAILRAVADGRTNSTEISSYLFSKRLIPKDNPGLIQKYLKILVEIGLLEKIKVFNKKKFIYRHVSPLFDLHYYLDEKYGYSELEIPKKYIENVINIKIGVHAEQFFRNLFSSLTGYSFQKIEQPEVDISLFEFNRLKLVAEVKWKNKVNKKEIKSIEEKLNKFHDDVEKLLIVPSKNVLEKEPKDLRVLDDEDIVDLVEKRMKD